MTDKETLKQALKRDYQKNTLSDRQLAGLQKLQQNYQPESEDHGQPSQSPVDLTSRRPIQWIVGLCLSVLLAFSAGYFVSNHQHQAIIDELTFQAENPSSPYNTNRLVRDIAEEITFNHRKLKPLEVEASEFEPLVKYFSMLEFRPYLSGHFKTDGQLIGGRYCSIGSFSAVQFRFRNNDGDISTLYQTAYNSDAFKGLPDIEQGEDAIIQYLNGYQVTLWVEMGIVMAAVTSPE